MKKNEKDKKEYEKLLNEVVEDFKKQIRKSTL